MRPTISPTKAAASAILLCLTTLTACRTLDDVDRRVDEILGIRSGEMGASAPTTGDLPPARSEALGDAAAEWIPTRSPAADELDYTPAEQQPLTTEVEAQEIIERLNRYDDVADNAEPMTLAEALAYAFRNAPDFIFEQEEYVLAGLRLLIERHQWGPRFFNDTTASISGQGDDGTFDTAMRLVNEFRVTQRLPYGGEVSARALASAVEDLHGFVSDDGSRSADLVLSANIPLLRGAGQVARESRIQSERDTIYAAREYERFRRSFAVDVADAFLGLVVQQKAIGNQVLRAEGLLELAEREHALYRAGTASRQEAGLAENEAVRAYDSLARQRESFRVAVDQFKLFIGMPIDTPIRVIDSDPGLEVPKVELDEAVASAIANRLDLQTRRDQLLDSKRGVQNARNDLLPDLDLAGSVGLGTDLSDGNLDDAFGNSDFSASVTFGLPLDREIERLQLRSAQIRHERSRRDYDVFRDGVAIAARAAVRDIDRAIFSLEIQQLGVTIAEERKASIEAQEDRVTPRDTADAINDLGAAKDERDAARRDLQIAILDYLLATGQLRIRPDGWIETLNGMIAEQRVATPDPANP